MVCHIADAQDDGMLGPPGAERALIVHIQPEDCGHVKVIDTFIVLGFRFYAGDVDFKDERRSVLPSPNDRSAGLTPS